MTVKILQSRHEIDDSRDVLRRMGISCIPSRPVRALQRLGLMRDLNVGDHIKSWDVLETVRFVQDHMPKDAPILDIGAYASEVLCILHRLGYTCLTGVDLNPALPSMPYSDTIRYVISDFLQPPFPDQSFAAVTAISVIEHGFQSDRLLKEMSRLLRPGGYFIASFDYWPEKVRTDGMKLFDMDWTIFSREELLRLLCDARPHGFLSEDLSSDGEPTFEAADKVIRWGGKEYTFGWMALRKGAACASYS